MVLLASARSQRALIEDALSDREVPFAPVREAGVVDTEAGRAGYALLSVVVNPKNYVAHRTLVGVRKGVGVGTCNAIAKATIAANRNFRDLFYAPLPDGLLTALARRAVEKTSDLMARIVDWAGEDEMSSHVDELCEMVDEIRGEDAASDGLRGVLADLPPEISLAETHEFLGASNDEDRRKVLDAVANRLGEAPPEDSLVPRRVQVLTMHGAKGLSAQVVFIPGLEDQILPGEKRRPFPGLVLEAARMLYVAITRARVACILSYARNRFVNGAPTWPTPSRFTSSLGVTFGSPSSGIGPAEAVSIADAAAEMSEPTP
jgi:superfamily I DNA/RNA helicase